MEARRSKRIRPKVNYRKLSDTGRLPKAKKFRCKNSEDTLFPVTILETINHHVKIHYDGYATDFDKWRDENDIETIDQDINNSDEVGGGSVLSSILQYYQSFSLYGDLRNRIKRSLKCSRKGLPMVKIIVV